MSGNTTALDLARTLHAGQVDKGGVPYIGHLEAVAALLVRHWPDAPQWAIDAALLHDALEDTHATPQGLVAAGIAPRSVVIIQSVSRPEGVPYREFIATLARSGDIWAIRVKLVDNEHNSDPARRLPGSSIVERRYVPARAVLLEGHRDLEAYMFPTRRPDRDPPWDRDPHGAVFLEHGVAPWLDGHGEGLTRPIVARPHSPGLTSCLVGRSPEVSAGVDADDVPVPPASRS